MYPVARKLARLENSLDGISRKIKNLIPQVERVEFEARALRHAKAQKAGRSQDSLVPPASLEHDNGW
jgi:hypothetical protein